MEPDFNYKSGGPGAPLPPRRTLKQLLEEEIIDASTYELAVSEPLPDEPHPLNV